MIVIPEQLQTSGAYFSGAQTRGYNKRFNPSQLISTVVNMFRILRLKRQTFPCSHLACILTISQHLYPVEALAMKPEAESPQFLPKQFPRILSSCEQLINGINWNKVIQMCIDTIVSRFHDFFSDFNTSKKSSKSITGDAWNQPPPHPST